MEHDETETRATSTGADDEAKYMQIVRTPYTGTLNDLADDIGKWANGKGWWEGRDVSNDLPKLIALMHSELSEALEAWRGWQRAAFQRADKDGYDKPEGWAVELVDCIVRILDALKHADIDVNEIMLRKMRYNETRPHRHGGKRA